MHGGSAIKEMLCYAVSFVVLAPAWLSLERSHHLETTTSVRTSVCPQLPWQNEEWGRTFTDIPIFFRQSAELGLFSSAQIARFVSTDVRPTMTRTVTRALPHTGARAFVGRLMADPAFAQKLVLEGCFSVSLSLAWEYAQRGDRFFQELDFVAINTLCLAASTGALVWLMAPNRSGGAAYQSSWQSKLHSLPGNIFDRSTPVHQLSVGSRTGSFFWKSAQLAAVGALSGAGMSVLGNAETSLRRIRDPNFSPAVEVPSLPRSTLGMAASMGLASNLRYQAVAGLDRAIADRINFMWVGLLLSASARAANQWIGQPTRCWLQGLPHKVPQHKVLQRQQAARTAQFAAAQAQLEQMRRQQAVQAAKPKRRAPQAGSAGFEMSTQRQQARQQQPSMALASALLGGL
ncbi:hypothetical protein WJX73_010795 [Symbiochloris irregularis]|uniref:Uncharacterized protein n=1 Tax=Symbiochloris irregularis TaxID=706552 RepID=A0AAW1PJF6_9CHLO